MAPLQRARLVLLACAVLGARPAPARAAGAARASLPDSLSAGEFAELARRAAPDARAGAEDRAAAALDSTSAARRRRGSLSIFGDALVVPKDSYDPVVTNNGQYDLKAGIAWPLLDGGGFRREKERGAVGARSASFALARVGRDAALRAGVAALDVLRLRETERAQSDAIDWLERLATLVEAGARGGARGPSDRLRVTLERDAVVAALDQSRSLAEERGRELAELVGRPGERAPGVREAAADDAAPLASDSLATLEAATRAPEIGEALAAAERERLARDEARQRNALRMDLGADIGLSGADLTAAVPEALKAQDPNATFLDRVRGDFGGSVSMTFKLPVLDPSQRPGVAARDAGQRAAEARAQAATAEQRRISLDLIARWNLAARRLAAADSTARLADENLLRLRSLYAAGATSLLELLDARRTLDDARERVTTGRFELRAARLEAELRR